ncbi:hypothetical protein V8E54_013110 [Elaphomyces granulatus]
MALEASRQLANPQKVLEGFRLKEVVFHAALRVPTSADGIETHFRAAPDTISARFCSIGNRIGKAGALPIYARYPASSTSATAATNVTTDVSPEPVILQIQDNGNDLEEEGGDDFVDIDDMLLDDYCDGCYDTTTATATAATTARTVAATAAATAAMTQPRRRGRPKGSKDKELRKRRQKATDGGDTTATGS